MQVISKHKVPQSISILDATEIEEMGLKNSMDVLDQIPAMLTTPNYGVGVTFRRLKRSVFTENNPVVIHVDGVPISNSYGFDFSPDRRNRRIRRSPHHRCRVELQFLGETVYWRI